jgi:hypothetical protein
MAFVNDVLPGVKIVFAGAGVVMFWSMSSNRWFGF